MPVNRIFLTFNLSKISNMTQHELIEVFTEYLNFSGNWYAFIRHIKDRGYTMEDLGFQEDEMGEELNDKESK